MMAISFLLTPNARKRFGRFFAPAVLFVGLAKQTQKVQA